MDSSRRSRGRNEPKSVNTSLWKGTQKTVFKSKNAEHFPPTFFYWCSVQSRIRQRRWRSFVFVQKWNHHSNTPKVTHVREGNETSTFIFFLVLFLFFLSHEHQINDKWINSVNYPNVLWGDYCHHINGKKKKTWTSITGGHERKTTSASDKAYGLIVFKKIVVDYLLSTSVFSRAFQTHFLKFDKKCQNSRLPYSLVYQLSTTTHGLHQRKTTKAPERYNAWPLKY